MPRSATAASSHAHSPGFRAPSHATPAGAPFANARIGAPPRPDMHTAHDRLFRYVFSETEHARGLLAELVPSAVRDRIDWAPLRHLPGTFVAPELDQRHADVLFHVEIAGRPVLLYVLLEHQSQPDPIMPLRVLGYAVRVMEQHLREQGPKRVPLVLPIVVHHGDKAGPRRAPSRRFSTRPPTSSPRSVPTCRASSS